jgi:hypothetical protein
MISQNKGREEGGRENARRDGKEFFFPLSEGVSWEKTPC